MIKNLSKKTLFDSIYLLIGVIFYGCIAWAWHMPLATWIAPVFLMRFFRNQEKFRTTLFAFPLLYIASYFNKHGGWDLDPLLEMFVSILLPILITVPLYLDRYVTKKFQSGWGTLVYPSFLLIIEYLLGLTPLGSVFSFGSTQLEHTAILQLISIFGMWGLSFLIGWTASIINTVWDSNFDLRHPPKIAQIFAGIFTVLLLFGSFRIALTDPGQTVRIASISVPHPRDYWSEIVDKQTPPLDVPNYLPEFQAIENELFQISEQAALAGAEIIFWSEGNCPYYEDYEETFLNRSKIFAQTYDVYFAPAVLKLLYGTTLSENKIIMISPDGIVQYEYLKTISWYPTTSDGIIDYVDTPYGRIGSTICFDNDFPAFVQQAGQHKIDILLVPAFDTVVIKKFHGQTALLRGVENGLSVVRQSNQGCSYAVDYLGNIVAYQDYFDTDHRLMFSDLPIQGTFTIYSYLGDWFVYINLIFSVSILLKLVYMKITRKFLFRIK